jgi:hypothetical protein
MIIVCYILLNNTRAQNNQTDHKTDHKTDPDYDHNNYQKNPVILEDPVRSYDYQKYYDPLSDPTRRVPRHEIPPVYLKNMIDYPSRGYPDNYTQLGTLVLEHEEEHQDNQNRILRLFGRQIYPGSDTYEYYTMINSGLDQIKVPVYNRKRRRELYQDDLVYIHELRSKYRVNLYKYDYPRYYPDL